MSAEPAERWVRPALFALVALTLLRVAALALSPTDLFVDEAQYWLWSQSLAPGYFSKPPLIAFVIRLTTSLLQSDSTLAIRLAGPIAHLATALILGRIASRLADKKAALWAALTYLTLPSCSLGSLVISTDTVMAPFYALAVLCLLEMGRTRRPGTAFWGGVALGLALLAKYAALYLPGSALVALLFNKQARSPLRLWLMFLGTALVILSPNILWNLSHDLTTVRHTAGNVGWVQHLTFAPSLTAGLKFLAGQGLMVGPILVFGLVASLWRGAPHSARSLLIALALIPLGLVTLQALIAGANLNWAFAAWLPGLVLAVIALRNGPWLKINLVLNGAVSLAFIGLTLFPYTALPDQQPLLMRLLGRAALSEQVLAMAEAKGHIPIVTGNRDILADLVYTSRTRPVPLYAQQRQGRPLTHYELAFAQPDGLVGPVIFVSTVVPDCPGGPAPLAQPLNTDIGAYANQRFFAVFIRADCLPQL